MMMQYTLMLSLIALSYSLMPYPKQFQKGDKSIQFQSICSLGNSVSLTNLQNQDIPNHIAQIIQIYTQLILKDKQCDQQSTKQQRIEEEIQGYSMNLEIDNLNQLYYVQEAKEEAYTLAIDEELNVQIKAQNHWGLARALDTLEQLIEQDNTIHNLPLIINDEPAFAHRGVMVDTARHYLSVRTLEKTIDSLMINKMNILHWHITDDESFPLVLKEYPQITEKSKFWEAAQFSKSDVLHIVNYASVRGVAVIPEIDSPGHVMSWGMSQDLADMILIGGTIKQYGLLDPTMEKTYEVLTSIMQDLYEYFPNAPFIHFGGDEAITSWWNQRPHIKDFMKENGIADYDGLQTYYRQRQKAIWREIVKSNQNVAYWYRAGETLPAEDEDIIHWWGTTDQLSLIADRSNKVILSDYNTLYIDAGVGNAFGNKYSEYHSWKDIYKWSPIPPQGFKGKVIGAECPLWGETNNESTHFMKLFIRSSVLADTLWNPNTKETEAYYDFVTRLLAMEDRMINSGFGVSPVTSDFCKRHVQVCFPTLT